MATRRMPARSATVFDDFAVRRPTPVGGAGSSRVVLPARVGEVRPAVRVETVPQFSGRRSFRAIVASFAITIAQFSAKARYLRSLGFSRSMARRKALWHIR